MTERLRDPIEELLRDLSRPGGVVKVGSETLIEAADAIKRLAVDLDLATAEVTALNYRNRDLTEERNREKNSADLWAAETDKRADQRDAAEARIARYANLERAAWAYVQANDQHMGSFDAARHKTSCDLCSALAALDTGKEQS